MTDRKPTPAEVWRESMRRARTLNPKAITERIIATADTGLRATRYDAMGGRTTRIRCEDPAHCDDGPEDHSHLVSSDPTGNAAIRGRHNGSGTRDQTRLALAEAAFIGYASTVIRLVSSEDPGHTWQSVTAADKRLTPGTVQAGLDVDDERRLPRAIDAVHRAVSTVAAIAAEHLPRDPSQDEQHWTAGLADEDCCAWHLSIHRRYRRPKVGAFKGDRICADCMQLVLVAEARPPQWLLEAEVDRLSKPRVWQAALGRWMDELGLRDSA